MFWLFQSFLVAVSRNVQPAILIKSPVLLFGAIGPS